ncbi:hypothetical protein Tco_0383023 [Tanacetum coccineum]
MDSENNNEKFNMPSFPPPEPMVCCFDDLDFFNDFENEFPAIVYNDALTSKLDFLIEPTVSPQHIDEFNLKDETSFSKCDKEEQNILNFIDLFPFNVIYPMIQIDKDNDDDKQKARILELKRRYFEDYYSDNQYAVSIKEDTAYLCLHSPKTTKDTRPIRRIQERQYAVFKLYGNKILWKISNVVPTPRNSNTPYPIPWIRRLRKKYRLSLKNDMPPRDK